MEVKLTYFFLFIRVKNIFLILLLLFIKSRSYIYNPITSMKKMNQLLLCLLLSLLAMQCKEEKPEEEVNQLDLLPPATQSGRYTFGCLVNGAKPGCPELPLIWGLSIKVGCCKLVQKHITNLENRIWH